MKSGIINVYKEKGFTSFDVVAKLRGILRTKKIGHTGTLDPEAEGVLPVCLGKAREGKTVERKARNVQIFSIEILEMNLPRVRMSVHCSKGTYIRTLCHDIGQKLGSGGCMEKLLRTKVGVFELKDTLKLSEIDELAKAGVVEEKIISVD